MEHNWSKMDPGRPVVGIGELLWDVLPSGKQLGGAPANFACHVSQMGLDGVVVSAVGRDALGDEALAALAGRGLHSRIARVAHPTGTVQVSLDAAGVPYYDICTGVAWDNIPFTAELAALAASARAVCFGSLAQRSPVSRDTIFRFLSATPTDCLKVFDINLRQHFYSPEILDRSLRLADILKINDEEIHTLTSLLAPSASPDSPTSPLSPSSPTSLTSPAHPTSQVSPSSPTAPASPDTFISSSPAAFTSPAHPVSPASPSSPAAPASPDPFISSSPAALTSPVHPASQFSPSSSAAPASPFSSALFASQVSPDSSSPLQNSIAGGADLQRLGWWIKKQFSLKMVVLTCGAEGSYVFHDGGVSFQSSPKVEVVDTVGAGDSFTAAFVASLLRGCSVSDAHRRASEVAAYVCTQSGATPPLPPSLLSS